MKQAMRQKSKPDASRAEWFSIRSRFRTEVRDLAGKVSGLVYGALRSKSRSVLSASPGPLGNERTANRWHDGGRGMEQKINSLSQYHRSLPRVELVLNAEDV